jgi:hypothetical protein
MSASSTFSAPPASREPFCETAASKDPMRTKLPPNVTRERNRHGTPVYYYRIGKGARTRLPDYGTPEFEPAYQAALRGDAAPAVVGQRHQRQGTLSWLIAEYKQTLHFRGLDAVTQRKRESFYRQMIAKSGNEPLRAITEKSIIAAREKRTGGQGHAANNFLKAIRPVFAYAKTRGWIDKDPARDVAFVKAIKGSRLPWTIEDYQAFEKRYPLGTMPNLALRILLFAGPRRGDASHFGEQHIRDGKVRYRPNKTSKTSEVIVEFMLLPPLREAIDATAPIREAARRKSPTASLAFLLNDVGQPFPSAASFGMWFQRKCKAAGVAPRAHGLRKLGPALAAEWGASGPELMAMWGWTTLAQATLYTRSADRKRMGDTAAAKLLEGFTAAQSANKHSPHLE